MPVDTAKKTRVLLVEDEALIAMLIEDLLQDLGCEVVATVGHVAEALDAAGNLDFDLAFLDVNLGGVPVYPIAAKLQQRAVPFAFVTGYGSMGVDAAYRTAPVLQKPFQVGDLEVVLDRLRQLPGGTA